MDLGINVSKSESGTVVATTGELDVHSAGSLEQALQDLIGQGDNTLVLDLTGLEFLDSTGLGVMVKALKWAQDAGGSLRVVADDEKITKVFTITGLDQALSLTSTTEGNPG